MDRESLAAAQKDIIQRIEENKEELEEIRYSYAPLMEKWQALLAFLLPIQTEVIGKYGFPEDQRGLTDFNNEWMKQAAEDEGLRALNDKKWTYLLEKAFGVVPEKELTLEEARALIEDIAEAMTAEDFLREVEMALGKLDESPMVLKRQELLKLLFPVQMAVMEKHGFKGDDGYIQAQRALMDHTHDPQIIKNASFAQVILFRRAKLFGDK